MRQRLGANKLARCCAVSGRNYSVALVRGNTQHFVARCWYSDRDADYVNYKAGWWEPLTRNGQCVNDDHTKRHWASPIHEAAAKVPDLEEQIRELYYALEQTVRAADLARAVSNAQYTIGRWPRPDF